MLQQTMHKAMTAITQADKVLYHVVLPVAVNMMQIDRPVGIRHAAQHTTPLVAPPRDNTAFAIGLTDAKLFFGFQRRAHRIDHTLAPVLPGALHSRKHVCDTMASRAGGQTLIAMHTQPTTQMVFCPRLRHGLALFQTVVTRYFAIRCRSAAGSALAPHAAQNGADCVVMNSHNACRFTEFSRFRIDGQDAVAINNSRSGHRCSLLSVSMSKMLNCTKNDRECQHISNAMRHNHVAFMGESICSLIDDYNLAQPILYNDIGIAVDPER